MTKRAVFVLLAFCIAGCSPPHYDLAKPGKAFLASWNDSALDDYLRIKVESRDYYRSNDGHFSVSYDAGKNSSWMLITPIQGLGDMLCGELLIQTAGLSYDHAQSLVDKAKSGHWINEGNLQFHMDRNAAVICSVSTKTASAPGG